MNWTAVFFISALVSAVIGFSGAEVINVSIAKIFFFVFLAFGSLGIVLGRYLQAS